MFLANNEQRKHLAVTLRAVGIGLLIPVFGKYLLEGIAISDGNLITLFILSGVLEIEALSILGGIYND